MKLKQEIIGTLAMLLVIGAVFGPIGCAIYCDHHYTEIYPSQYTEIENMVAKDALVASEAAEAMADGYISRSEHEGIVRNYRNRLYQGEIENAQGIKAKLKSKGN